VPRVPHHRGCFQHRVNGCLQLRPDLSKRSFCLIRLLFKVLESLYQRVRLIAIPHDNTFPNAFLLVLKEEHIVRCDDPQPIDLLAELNTLRQKLPLHVLSLNAVQVQDLIGLRSDHVDREGVLVVDHE
jgi:hypothetical protein